MRVSPKVPQRICMSVAVRIFPWIFHKEGVSHADFTRGFRTRTHKRKASFQTGLRVAFTVRVFCLERFLGSGISFSFT